MLLLAQNGDKLIAPTSGLGTSKFIADGDSFALSGGHAMEAYQGKGPYLLEYTDELRITRKRKTRFANLYDDTFDPVYCNATGTNCNMDEGALQPVYDYTPGGPEYTDYYRYVYYNGRVDSDWEGGSGHSFIVSTMLKSALKDAGLGGVSAFLGPVGWVNNSLLRQRMFLTVEYVNMREEYPGWDPKLP